MGGLLFLLSNCTLVWYPTEENYTCDAPYFQDIEALRVFCIVDITYRYDSDLYGPHDYWAAPDQTLSNMAGDCEDKAILFAYIAHTQFNLEPELIMEQLPEGLHVYCLMGCVAYLSASRGTALIVRRWTYEEAMWIATHKHCL